MAIAQKLANARYVSLATLRKDGREVRTPVWMAPAEGRHYIFSAGNVGKVKRIRANPNVRLAVCDARGSLLGDWTDAAARIVSDEARVALAYRALRAKYGWQMWLVDIGSKLTGRFHSRAIIEISPISASNT